MSARRRLKGALHPFEHAHIIGAGAAAHVEDAGHLGAVYLHVASLIRRIMGLILAALSVDIILTSVAKWLSLPPI